MKDNLLDESKHKGQDKYCVPFDTSIRRDLVFYKNDDIITKSKLIKHCEKQIEMSPKNSMRYKEHFLLLCFLTGIPVSEENVIIDGKPEQVFLLPK